MTVIDHEPFDLGAELFAVAMRNIVLDRAVMKEIEESKRREEEAGVSDDAALIPGKGRVTWAAGRES